MTNVLNLDEYATELRRWAENEPIKAVVLVQKKMALLALTTLVLNTPVDEGRARGNWFVSIGVPSNAVTDALDPSGSGTINAGSAVALSLVDLGVIWISNNLEHAVVLDQGLFEPPDPGPSSDPRADRFGRVLVSGGYSTQAPAGMTALAITTLRNQFP